MIRNMFKEKAPEKFWEDVVACALYLLNRFPTKKNGNVHIRIFECVAYAKVLEEKRIKLEVKG